MIAKLDKSDILLALTRIALVKGIPHQELRESIYAKEAEALALIFNDILNDKETLHLMKRMQTYPFVHEDI